MICEIFALEKLELTNSIHKKLPLENNPLYCKSSVHQIYVLSNSPITCIIMTALLECI